MVIEFMLGGVAACGAGFFTNPLEVVKTRMQLQGELKAKGHYRVCYRNVFHAFYAIGKYDGILALQKGLVPALYYQFFMNGLRLGAYQCFVNVKFTQDANGNASLPRCVFAGAIAGCVGAFFGSPIYMVREQTNKLRQQPVDIVRKGWAMDVYFSLLFFYEKKSVSLFWWGRAQLGPPQ